MGRLPPRSPLMFDLNIVYVAPIVSLHGLTVESAMPIHLSRKEGSGKCEEFSERVTVCVTLHAGVTRVTDFSLHGTK